MSKPAEEAILLHGTRNVVIRLGNLSRVKPQLENIATRAGVRDLQYRDAERNGLVLSQVFSGAELIAGGLGRDVISARIRAYCLAIHHCIPRAGLRTAEARVMRANEYSAEIDALNAALRKSVEESAVAAGWGRVTWVVLNNGGSAVLVDGALLARKRDSPFASRTAVTINQSIALCGALVELGAADQAVYKAAAGKLQTTQDVRRFRSALARLGIVNPAGFAGDEPQRHPEDLAEAAGGSAATATDGVVSGLLPSPDSATLDDDDAEMVSENADMGLDWVSQPPPEDGFAASDATPDAEPGVVVGAEAGVETPSIHTVADRADSGPIATSSSGSDSPEPASEGGDPANASLGRRKAGKLEDVLEEYRRRLRERGLG